MKRQCLLIDDDLDDQEIFLIAVNRVDPEINCIAKFDSAVAIKELKANTSSAPDFIFLDINMPRMGGLQCLQELRKAEHLRSVKIVMYSTTLEEKIKASAIELGASAFLVKQHTITALINSLTGILGG